MIQNHGCGNEFFANPVLVNPIMGLTTIVGCQGLHHPLRTCIMADPYFANALNIALKPDEIVDDKR